jgi:hypothetical protein
MMPANIIAADLQRVISLVTVLVEGGIDPSTSHRAQATWTSLVHGLSILEEALEHWRERPTEGDPR